VTETGRAQPHIEWVAAVVASHDRYTLTNKLRLARMPTPRFNSQVASVHVPLAVHPLSPGPHTATGR
jgi:hypothetical protein